MLYFIMETHKILTIIADGYNTDYMSSLIIALFYRSSCIEDILNVTPNDYRFIYIQELIKYKMVDLLRQGYSIHEDILNEIRNYINLCGWAKNAEELLEKRNILDFYTYLLPNIGDGSNQLVTTDGEKSFKYECVIVQDDKKNLSDLIDDWFYLNIEGKTQTIMNYPKFMAIYIDRKKDENNEINIMKAVKLPSKEESIYDILWDIHSLICFNTERQEYYSVNYVCENMWFLFTDKEIPSGKSINMYEKKMVDKISSEVIFVFYKMT